jgi:Tol biopolymer transport system component
MLFTRNNYLDGKYKTSKDGINKLKLYSADWTGNEWGKLKELPFNSDEYSVGHPSLSKDDKLLYFVSDMREDLEERTSMSVNLKTTTGQHLSI